MALAFSSTLVFSAETISEKRVAYGLAAAEKMLRKTPSMKKDEQPAKTPEILFLEEKFLEATGCRVEIKGKYKNGAIAKGKVLIPFKNAEELERIYQILAPGSDLYD